MANAGTRAIDVVRSAGVYHLVHEYSAPERSGRERDVRPSYGRDAAAALGIDPERLFKTLVVVADRSPVLAIVPVAGEVDLGAVAALRGARRAALADPMAAERLTGYRVGGISPLGCRRDLPAILDETAILQDTIFVSAGRRGLQLELTPRDLAKLASADIAAIARMADR